MSINHPKGKNATDADCCGVCAGAGNVVCADAVLCCERKQLELQQRRTGLRSGSIFVQSGQETE